MVGLWVKVSWMMCDLSRCHSHIQHEKRDSELCRLVAWHVQLVAYFSRVGRICPTSVIGRQVGAEFFGENPSLGGSGEQFGRQGFGSPGNSRSANGIPATGACRSFLSHSAIVSELFGRAASVPGCFSGGMGEPRWQVPAARFALQSHTGLV